MRDHKKLKHLHFLRSPVALCPRFHPRLLLRLKLGFGRFSRSFQLIKSVLSLLLVGGSEGVGFSPEAFQHFLPGFPLSLSPRRKRLLQMVGVF